MTVIDSEWVLYIMAHIHYGRSMVTTKTKTKLFMSGNSQVLRIPHESQRRGNTLVIGQKKQTWQFLTDSLTMFTDDFMGEGRQQPPIQKRKRPFA